MPSFIITGLETTAQILGSNEVGFVGAAGELVVTGGDAVTGSGTNRLVVLGNISTLSTGNNDAYVFAGTDLDVFVGAAGSIISVGSDGIVASASSRMEVLNSGTIMADATGISLSASDVGATINVANFGTINGTTGISLNSGTSATEIANSGTIITNGTSISVASPTGNTDLVNTGTISSASFTAVSLGGGNDNALNSGTVLGRFAMGSGNDKLVNTGTIVGEVDLGSGDDLYDGSNGIQTDRWIEGESGNDTIMGGDGAETIDGGNNSDILHGGGGNDVFLGSGDTADDEIDGGEGIDTIKLLTSGDLVINLASGFAVGGFIGVDTLISIENAISGAGDDRLFGDGVANFFDGGGGNDRIKGRDGNDRLKGNLGEDTLRGDDGNDRLFGGADDDMLFGGEGNDILIGGLGQDVLQGDVGADRLVFRDIAESGITNVSGDRINGFEQGLDVIDMSGIDAVSATVANEDFVFIGTSAFGGVAGELRYFQTSNKTYIDVDVDGDTIRDMRVRVNDLVTFTVDDFIL